MPGRRWPLKEKRLTMICASLSLLQIMFAVHAVRRRRNSVRSFLNFSVFLRASPSSFLRKEPALQDILFCIILPLHNKHSADWLTAFATPYPAAPAPLCRGENKPLYAFLWSHVAHCLAPIVPPLAEGKVVAKPPKGVPLFPRPKGRLLRFYHTGAPSF